MSNKNASIHFEEKVSTPRTTLPHYSYKSMNVGDTHYHKKPKAWFTQKKTERKAGNDKKNHHSHLWTCGRP